MTTCLQPLKSDIHWAPFLNMDIYAKLTLLT